jgi:hypothetical protein
MFRLIKIMGKLVVGRAANQTVTETNLTLLLLGERH